MKSALTSSLLEKIKKETIYLLAAFAVLAIILKIAFIKENFSALIRASLSILWLFILPGFYILYWWHEKLEFIERLIISFVLSTALAGISSYYLGLFGLHIKYHSIIIPLMLLISSVVLITFKLKSEKKVAIQ